ncbi:MAG TPA: hypothetical protein VIV54_04740 [Burkholderiales bacterium]
MANKIAGLFASMVLALAACGGGSEDIKVEVTPIQMYRNCMYRYSYSGPPYWSCMLVGECQSGGEGTTCVACPTDQPLTQC